MGGQGFDFGAGGAGAGDDSDDDEPPKLDDLEGEENVEKHTKAKDDHDHSKCTDKDHKH